MMTQIKKRKPNKLNRHPKPSSKKNSLTLDELVVDGSLPLIKVRVYPSRNKSRSKSNNRIVIELQCEV